MITNRGMALTVTSNLTLSLQVHFRKIKIKLLLQKKIKVYKMNLMGVDDGGR